MSVHFAGIYNKKIKQVYVLKEMQKNHILANFKSDTSAKKARTPSKTIERNE